VSGFNLEDVIKIEEDVSREAAIEPTQAHVLFEVDPLVLDVPVLHLPESHPPTTETPEPTVVEEPIAGKLEPREVSGHNTNNDHVQHKDAHSDKISKDPVECAISTGLTSAPTSTITAEGVASSRDNLPTTVISKKQLLTEEVKAWLARQNTLKRGPIQQLEQQGVDPLRSLTVQKLAESAGECRC
jgi:hypothetical protein